MGLSSEIMGLPHGVDTLLRELIHERTGLHYDNGKSDLLADKLSPLVIERGFSSFLDYYYLLKYDDAAVDEWQRVMNALSVQETYFWREIDQIRTFVDVLVPEWYARHNSQPLRLWSSACATGEEPLSIAIALKEAGWFDRLPIEILASDGSSTAIAKAKKGLYRERAFRNLPQPLREKYFEKAGTEWRVKSGLASRIKWMTANLAKETEIAPLASVPFIFCRNVFIYFSPQTISKTVAMFARRIQPPGYLFVSVSESLLKLTHDFELQEIGGTFVYVRR
jgi:chemotaxis protein methyltransferase CheR